MSAAQDASALARLAPLVERQALRHGLYTPIEGLMTAHFVSPSEPFATVQRPVYSVVVQGIKEAMIGDRVVRYHAGQSLVAGVDLPVTSRIIEASETRPYLSVSVEIDGATVYELTEGAFASRPPVDDLAAFEIRDFEPRLADPLARLLALLDEDPGDVSVLAPLIRKEIVWRLLQGPFGPLLRRLAGPDGDVARIARATGWIRENFAEPLKIPELADRVSMSVPSFHRHFKTVTSVTPLQFHKHVRLHIARRRLLAREGVGTVAFDVGYESLSQFNRDYRKLYGLAPSQDVASLRQTLQGEATPS